MEKLNLKTKLFGYGKLEVCTYIADLNNECYQKLQKIQKENDEEGKRHAEELAELKREHAETEAALREEIARLTKECEEYRGKRDSVAGALLDAQVYANELRAKANENAKAMRAENQAAYEKQEKRLAEYIARADGLIQSFRQILDQSESMLAPLSGQMEELGEEMAAEREKMESILFSADNAGGEE